MGICALVLSGCYAAVGPTIGINVPDSRPTLGWELSAATLTVGQSYAFGTPKPNPDVMSPSPSPELPWVRRTYFAWEPRFGGVPQGQFMVGAGATLGGRWDVATDGTKMDAGRFIGGGFAGTAIPIHPRSFELGGRADFYFSVAIGVRGGEFYLAPKVGVLQEPELTLSIGSFN